MTVRTLPFFFYIKKYSYVIIYTPISSMFLLVLDFQKLYIQELWNHLYEQWLFLILESSWPKQAPEFLQYESDHDFRDHWSDTHSRRHPKINHHNNYQRLIIKFLYNLILLTWGPTWVICKLYPSTRRNRSSLVTIRLAAVRTAAPLLHNSTNEPKIFIIYFKSIFFK